MANRKKEQKELPPLMGDSWAVHATEAPATEQSPPPQDRFLATGDAGPLKQGALPRSEKKSKPLYAAKPTPPAAAPPPPQQDRFIATDDAAPGRPTSLPNKNKSKPLYSAGGGKGEATSEGVHNEVAASEVAASSAATDDDGSASVIITVLQRERFVTVTEETTVANDQYDFYSKHPTEHEFEYQTTVHIPGKEEEGFVYGQRKVYKFFLTAILGSSSLHKLAEDEAKIVIHEVVILKNNSLVLDVDVVHIRDENIRELFGTTIADNQSH